jgi:hypothetical protein
MFTIETISMFDFEFAYWKHIDNSEVFGFTITKRYIIILESYFSAWWLIVCRDQKVGIFTNCMYIKCFVI